MIAHFLLVKNKRCRAVCLYRNTVFIKFGRISDIKRNSFRGQRNNSFKRTYAVFYLLVPVSVHISNFWREYSHFDCTIRIIRENRRQTEVTHTSVTRTHFSCSNIVFPVVDIYLFAHHFKAMLIFRYFFKLSFFGSYIAYHSIERGTVPACSDKEYSFLYCFSL